MKYFLNLVTSLPLLGILYFSPDWLTYTTSLFTNLPHFPKLISERTKQILEKETFPRDTLPSEVVEMVTLLREKKATSYLQSEGFQVRDGRYKQRLAEGAWPVRFKIQSENNEPHGFVVILPTEKTNFPKCETAYSGKENLLVHCP